MPNRLESKSREKPFCRGREQEHLFGAMRPREPQRRFGQLVPEASTLLA
jgi:hypothetical protein